MGQESAVPHKDIGRALIDARRDITSPRADHDRLPADRHRLAELVTCRRVRGEKLLLLGPDSATSHKHIGRAWIAARCARTITSADHYRLPADRHRVAERVSCRRVRGD